MATWITALSTSDPSLLRCELDRVRDEVTLSADYAASGAWHDGMVLQRRYASAASMEQLWDVPDSEVVVLTGGNLPIGTQLDDHAQPFRFHQWLFSQVGHLPGPEAVRERLVEQLPDFLQGMIRGKTLAEAVFAEFLAGLRPLGRIDDPTLDPVSAGRALQASLRVVEQLSSELVGGERPRLAVVASNGRLLVGARRGGVPLRYRLLEGQVACRRCGLAADAPEKDTLVRDHRRRRSVVLSADVRQAPRDQPQVADGGFVAVDRKLSVHLG
jgi:hypothetical protein